MLIWSLTRHHQENHHAEWDALSKRDLGEDIHSDRKKGYILAREALRLSLLEWGASPLITELQLSDYCRLEKWPEIRVSLSHSKWAGAALIASKSEYLSVGIDIESEERQIKESTVERVSHPKDITLKGLEIWCLKEAIFKCLMNTGKFSQNVEFSHIEIQEGGWLHSPSKLVGHWELKSSYEQHVLALAFLRA